MIPDSPGWTLGHGELEDDAAQIHHVDEFLDVRALAVHQLDVLVLRAGSRPTRLCSHEHSARMLFRQPRRKPLPCPLPDSLCVLVQANALRLQLGLQPETKIVGGGGDLRIAGVSAILILLTKQPQALDASLLGCPIGGQLEQVDLAGSKTIVVLELALQFDAAEVGARSLSASRFR